MTMKWKVFIGASLSAWGISLASPGFAQDSAPSGNTPPAEGQAPTDPPAPPSSGNPAPAAPTDGAETRPASPSDSPAPASEPPPAEAAPPPAATVELPPVPMVDELPRKIGDKLSPLVVTAALGYGYASLSYPGLNSGSITGPYIELTAGTEIDPRVRLSFGLTSLETKIRRSSNGGWEEGDFTRKVATTSSGLRGMADPIEPVAIQGGGAEVQRTMHSNVIGPRIDYFPLGSQGPYLGATAAVAVLSGIDTYVGFDASARVGAEWRPFQELGFSIEGGAHGQFYDGAKATIPYGLARLNLLLDPSELSSNAAARRGTNVIPPTQRTLPTSTTPH